MFSPIQIKHECMGVEDVNCGNRINTLDTSKYPIFINDDVDYKYNQLPQFWSHTQLSNEIQPKNEVHNQQCLFQMEESGSLAYMKGVQNGMLFQVNQEGSTDQNQMSQQYHISAPQKIEQLQLPQDTQQSKFVNQMLTTSSSVSSIKPNRPGRPPKSSSESSVGKKFKCQCEICFKEFGHKSNLFIHMRTHNGERPYKCNQCEKCFTHSGNLAIHMRTHSGERPYGCQICGKMFSHSGNLSTHLRTHSGVKPYKCNICGKEFRHSGNLSIHERIHSGIKPFQCKVCGKDFYHSGNLTTHMKKHTVNSNVGVNQCESNVCAAVNNNNTPPLNLFNNLPLSSTTDVYVIPNANNIVPIKNESNDEGLTSAIRVLTST
ncbi:zinc finger protein 836-like isoform X1 [Hylaeus anthracinus]|uniref:zinc finger protein 836-like isoform X1 n=2 Tax=Hylaeus anthracinus TaxID=313031 RepID=UPI0023B8B5E3|nr:zinc finger protein 836-like isoform X1 [Hylaeus anthracinus]XP_053999567.1 zinc finger protein 836-like isoform X1 [Hylaeus anthracinus]